ncbi:MAG TPA: cation transporter [Holophagaceae bacterium]|nr:cation transporter [Holophagaceae bacterium]
MRPDAASPRDAWTRYAVGLAVFTVAYNLVEGLVSMGFGWAGDSVALFGFGADSFIEVGSALLILWRLRVEAEGCAASLLQRERRAAKGIGLLLLALAAGAAGGALLQLAGHRHPETTLPGLLVALLSLSFMYFLWREKRKAARALDSRALEADAACSFACMQLSGVLFTGSLVYLLLPRLWWADAAAALLLSAFIAKEGWETVRAASKEDFSGGCGCH